eukprot:418734-Amphidinium_carterae.1
MSKPSNNETRWYYRRILYLQVPLLHLSNTRRWQRPWWRDLTVMLVRDAGSITSAISDALMTTPGRAWDLCRLGTTAKCPGMNRCLWLYGSSAAGMPLT